MTKIKLITAFLYLIILGYYGETFGTLPQMAGMFISFASGTVLGMVNTLFQLIALIFLVYTAIARPYYRNEKSLYLFCLFIFGINAIAHLFVLQSVTLITAVLSVTTVILFFFSIGAYGKTVLKAHS
ncbi:hypothetical protein [Rubrolithibacter danxiaensis]|uniref:hypothetical protein n=1 Tax=Rubrolithibacter danxiaensis TaxID=3390805 RepID=UPI003BF885A4